MSPTWLDDQCLAGRIAWALALRPAATTPRPTADAGRRARRVPTPVRTTPITLLAARHARSGARCAGAARTAAATRVARARRRCSDCLRTQGASFFDELVEATGLLRPQVEEALGELVALGLVTSDSFGGLRALLVPSERRKPSPAERGGGARMASAWRMPAAGR